MRLGSDRKRSLAALILAGAPASWLVFAQPAVDPFDGDRAGAVREIGGASFCWAPAGSFRMGSPPDEPERRDDERPIDVTLIRGFWTRA